MGECKSDNQQPQYFIPTERYPLGPGCPGKFREGQTVLSSSDDELKSICCSKECCAAEITLKYRAFEAVPASDKKERAIRQKFLLDEIKTHTNLCMPSIAEGHGLTNHRMYEVGMPRQEFSKVFRVPPEVDESYDISGNVDRFIEREAQKEHEAEIREGYGPVPRRPRPPREPQAPESKDGSIVADLWGEYFKELELYREALQTWNSRSDELLWQWEESKKLQHDQEQVVRRERRTLELEHAQRIWENDRDCGPRPDRFTEYPNVPIWPQTYPVSFLERRRARPAIEEVEQTTLPGGSLDDEITLD